ncbi:putative zinc-binding metallopeptidase [Nocardioides sambongensis]|uniref:putative zinc-binding metallopeptidase n=1 Tax=Nocardioides sambongensis TaxID=2589074 RepID=UPI001E347CC6|nr:putative zinc-binding metallopeptidase [Nocardioides sambongensis]
MELDARGISTDGLVFDLLSSSAEAGEDVVIGHADGVITIDLAESDDARRERIRVDLGEPYRTMLGHLRHETGHFVQMGLLQSGDQEQVARCRELFGDDTADYQAAIDRHYAEGAPEGWEQSYISTYATMHPFEDFAETFAHVLHISDTCETAAEHGLLSVDPSAFSSFGDLVRGVWVPFSIALNQINRSMGKADVYPFVIPDRVVEKLEFVAGLFPGPQR